MIIMGDDDDDELMMSVAKEDKRYAGGRAAVVVILTSWTQPFSGFRKSGGLFGRPDVVRKFLEWQTLLRYDRTLSGNFCNGGH